MGEVPASRVGRPALRSLVPIVLVALIVAAAGYEWYRNQAAPARRAEPAPAAVAPEAPTVGTARTQLANPLSPSSTEAAPAEHRVGEASTSPAPAPEPSTPVAPGNAPEVSTPGPAAQVADAPATAATATTAPAADAPLVLSYRAAAWTQVRDARGQVLLNRVVPAGSEQPIRGTPPFDVTIGNARAVTLVYRGQAIDLARYTRQNIARLQLP
jgi:cytoskeleton protein RodZ